MVLTGCGFIGSRKPCKQCNWERRSFLRVFISSVFVPHSSGKYLLQKSQPMDQDFLLKNKWAIFSGLYLIRLFIQSASGILFQIHHLHITLWEESLVPASTSQASCRTKVSNSLMQSGICDACMNRTLNSSSSTEALLRISNSGPFEMRHH